MHAWAGQYLPFIYLFFKSIIWEGAHARACKWKLDGSASPVSIFTHKCKQPSLSSPPAEERALWCS